MCKRRRASLPPLPTTIDYDPRAIQTSSFADVQQRPYYCCHISTITSGDADVFARDVQFDMLTRSAEEVKKAGNEFAGT